MPTIKTKATLDRSEYESGLDALKSRVLDFNQSLGQTGGMMAAVFGGNFLSNALTGALSAFKAFSASAREEVADLGKNAGNIGGTNVPNAAQ